MFILMYFMGNKDYFIEKYSVWGYGIVNNNEFYRLITGTFLHGGIEHYLFNMYALYIIGSQMEGFLGRWKYLTVYIYSALIGSLFSIIFNGIIPSVGASGAIFGLMGSLL